MRGVTFSDAQGMRIGVHDAESNTIVDPPGFLKPGDVVAIAIEPIGTLENPVA